MKYWVKFLVFIALAISIPLQGIAAATMPVCIDSPLSSNTTKVDHVANNAEVTEISTDCHLKTSRTCIDENSKDCSTMNCSFCHVSLFQLPNANNIVFIDSHSTAYSDLTIPLYQHFSPPLLHPPKQSLS